ncbi:TNF receptor-associated factor family protein DDB_G0272098 [Pectinophora gossypiella]|uniref:TNF receptor-associated factor family protein DDB_G0272098 n=1 Tax=Pectinophora gossypiella TaxID=13191 RepID=UPI00214E3A9B|nr:TNF receptor-associated factor family protein DDB_G0272098 [Pectinophora gossypiella]
MSLLEDIFLQDEANEAQELERIIEGDEYDERPRNEENSDANSEKEDEAEEDKRRVDPASTKTKRVIKNPRFVLNPARLTGPRGIQVIPDHFKDFKFKGKGHEKEDLDLVLKKLEHWAYRLYPKFQFGDCLKKIETLGKKRPVMVHLHKIRSDQFLSEETVVQRDSSDDEAPAPPQEEDEFDKLLQQQIELAHATPTPGSVRKPAMSTPMPDKRTSLMMPKATSSPSISDEQRERMMRNRKLAEERRLARLKTANTNTSTDGVVPMNTGDNSVRDDTRAKKNKLQVIDSTDDEGDASTVNQAIIVDVHKTIDENVIDITEGYTNKNGNIESNEIIDIDKEIETNRRKPNKSNVLDSSDDSDDDCNVTTVNEAITVDIHDNIKRDDTAKILDKISLDSSKGDTDKNSKCISENENDDMQVESVETEASNKVDEVIVINNRDDKNTDETEEGTEQINLKRNSVEENETVATIDTNNGTENSSSDQILKKGDETTLDEENNDDNKDSELLDDVMDVDFTEDF